MFFVRNAGFETNRKKTFLGENKKIGEGKKLSLSTRSIFEAINDDVDVSW
jgi:hypothetical protein